MTQAIFPFQFWWPLLQFLGTGPSASLGVLQANPSPTVGTVTFTYDRSMAGGSIQVQDASGRVVETLIRCGGWQHHLPGEHLPSGVTIWPFCGTRKEFPWPVPPG